MSVQVQLRGGTTEEHASFTGAPREVTVDTTKGVLVVHDGVKVGGTPLAKEKELTDFEKRINDRLEEFSNNIGTTHNHDNLYSKLGHNHDDRYAVLPTGCNGSFLKQVGYYNGFAGSTGNDTSYLRTTKSGLLPYQSGGASNIGSPSWRFLSGYFNSLNTKGLTVDDGTIKFLNTNGKISFNTDDDLYYNDTYKEYSLTSDGSVNKSRLRLGHIELSGVRVYTGSVFPSGARVGDILIQV